MPDHPLLPFPPALVPWGSHWFKLLGLPDLSLISNNSFMLPLYIIGEDKKLIKYTHKVTACGLQNGVKMFEKYEVLFIKLYHDDIRYAIKQI